MYYAQMRKYDIANGLGIRATLFVSGCTHQCPGCFNTEYRDFKYGTLWDEAAEEMFMGYVKDQNVHGVSILGGEPMQQDFHLAALLKRIKEETGIYAYVAENAEECVAVGAGMAISVLADKGRNVYKTNKSFMSRG